MVCKLHSFIVTKFFDLLHNYRDTGSHPTICEQLLIHNLTPEYGKEKTVSLILEQTYLFVLEKSVQDAVK